MPYPTTYSWPLAAPTASAPLTLPSAGPPVQSYATAKDVRATQFQRGIKLANIPGGKADNVESSRFHANSVQGILLPPISSADRSGLVAFRQPARYSNTPQSILRSDVRSSDRFGNPVFYFTGLQEHVISIDIGFWNVQSLVSSPRARYIGDINEAFIQSGTIWIAGGLDDTQTPLDSVLVFSTGTNEWAALASMPGPKSDGAGCTLLDGNFIVVGGSGSVAAEMTASYLYITASNSWQVLPGTICSRKDHKIIRLSSPANGFVFAPGGTGLSGSSVPFTGSELFNPNTNTWYSNQVSGTSGYMPPIPIYPYDREGYTLTSIPNGSGSVVLIGGRDPLTGEANSHVLLFTPPNISLPGDQGTWRIENSMSFVRSDHQAVALDDGRVLIMGGNGGKTTNLKSLLPMYMGGQFGSLESTSEVEVYDYRDHSVRRVGQMHEARSNFAAALLPRDAAEGRVIVAGGNNIDTFLSGAEICDIETFAWKRVTSMQRPVSQFMMFKISSGSSSPYRFIAPSGLMTGSLTNMTSSQVYQTDG